MESSASTAEVSYDGENAADSGVARANKLLSDAKARTPHGPVFGTTVQEMKVALSSKSPMEQTRKPLFGTRLRWIVKALRGDDS